VDPSIIKVYLKSDFIRVFQDLTAIIYNFLYCVIIFILRLKMLDRLGNFLKAGFHERRSRIRSRNQKRRALRLVKIKQRSRKQSFLLRSRFHRLRSTENQFVGVVRRSRRTKPITKRGNEHCDWFLLSLLLPTPTVWFSLNRKQRNRKQSRKKVETF